MGKVRYKKPSENFQKITSVTEDKPLRYSIGKEEYVGEYYFLSVDSLIPYHLRATNSQCLGEKYFARTNG